MTLITSSTVAPTVSSIAMRFSIACLACPLMSPFTISPVSGLIGIWPEITKSFSLLNKDNLAVCPYWFWSQLMLPLFMSPHQGGKEKKGVSEAKNPHRFRSGVLGLIIPPLSLAFLFQVFFKGLCRNIYA